MKDFDTALQEILDYADQQGTRDECALDDEVHSIASAIATDVNNSGFEEQVKYILNHDGPTDETIESIKKLLQDNADETKPTTSARYCQSCGMDLTVRDSVIREYVNKDDGPNARVQGHYDANGEFEKDSGYPAEGRYDLCDDSDSCANCSCIVG